LTVDERVTEARFFLGKVSSVGPTDEDSVHYLSAFLSASRSIMGQLLRDNARKYGLGFGDDDPLDSRSFRDRAKSEGVQGALAFIDAYDQSISRLEKNGYYEVLGLRRNINVSHGAHPLLHNLSIMAQERIDETDTLTVRVERDTPIAVGPNPFRPVAAEPVTGSPSDFSFEDFPGERVPHVCEVYLSAILDEVAALRAGR
jgi:hypothetical protein